MIAVLQRVKRASVTVKGEIIGHIGTGLLILLGVCEEDDEKDVTFLTNKAAGLRIFSDTDGKMNRSIKDIGGEALVVSQFTLCGDWLKGRRPSFIHAAAPDKGNALYELFCEALRIENIPVTTGCFGAMMDVALINDGPVTFVLDSMLKNGRIQ